jgi:hypothetical protein
MTKLQPSQPKTGKALRRRRADENTSVAQVRQIEQHSVTAMAVSARSMIRSILPDKYHCTLKYCSSKQYTSGTGGIVGTTNTFQLNGLYDPDITGAGHQPYGFDQITPFYSVYTVRNARAVITVTGVDDSSNFLAWMIQPQNSSSTLASSTLEQVSELDEMNFVVLGQTTSGLPSQQINLPRLDLPKIEGLNWLAYEGNANYRALTSSGNPSSGTKLVVGIGNAAGTVSKVATLTVEIWFDAYFQGRKSLPQS